MEKFEASPTLFHPKAVLLCFGSPFFDLPRSRDEVLEKNIQQNFGTTPNLWDTARHSQYVSHITGIISHFGFNHAPGPSVAAKVEASLQVEPSKSNLLCHLSLPKPGQTRLKTTWSTDRALTCSSPTVSSSTVTLSPNLAPRNPCSSSLLKSS